jgi:hypothetical protein
MNRVITLITNSQIKEMKSEYLRVLFKTRKDSIPLNGEKVTLDIKYVTGKKHAYFVRVFNIGFTSIDDLIQAIFHFTKYVDHDTVFSKILIRFSHQKN